MQVIRGIERNGIGKPDAGARLIVVGLYLHDPVAMVALKISRRQMFDSDAAGGNCGMRAWGSETIHLHVNSNLDEVAVALAHQVHLFSTWSQACSIGITSAGTRTDTLRPGGPLAKPLEQQLAQMGERVVPIPVPEAKVALTGSQDGGRLRYIEAPDGIPYGGTVNQRRWRDVVKGHRYPRAMALAAALAVARRILWDERLEAIRVAGAATPTGK